MIDGQTLTVLAVVAVAAAYAAWRIRRMLRGDSCGGCREDRVEKKPLVQIDPPDERG